MLLHKEAVPKKVGYQEAQKYGSPPNEKKRRVSERYLEKRRDVHPRQQEMASHPPLFYNSILRRLKRVEVRGQEAQDGEETRDNQGLDKDHQQREAKRKDLQNQDFLFN